MKRSPTFFSSIRSRVILTTLLPLILINVTFTSFVINLRQSEAEELLINTSHHTAELVAAAAEYAIFTENLESLASLSLGALDAQSNVGISYLDSDKSLIASHGTPHAVETLAGLTTRPSPLFKNKHEWNFTYPVFHESTHTHIFNINTKKPSEHKTQVIIGWVSLSVTDRQVLKKQEETLVNSAAFSLAGLILSLAMALRISNSISKPIIDLRNVVQKIESGDLSARAETPSTNELQDLASGLNKMAERVSDSNQHLESKVHSATERLQESLDSISEQNIQLAATKEELVEAANAKDQFLARMSHELRTPLTTVIGFTRLLKKTSKDESQKEFIHSISQASNLLLSIIDDILDFSKMRVEKVQLEQIAFDFEKCMEDIVSMHAPAAFNKKLELVLLIDSDMPRFIIGDEMRLKQIINNLLSNAIKFTASGEVITRISLLDIEKGKANFIISVKDSGVGIAPSNLESLFQPFSQADTSITRRFGGSGLGLVITKQLTELMEGSIDVDSLEGRGTNISVNIALEIGDNSENDAIFDSNDGKVVLYEPHAWSRRALRNYLTMWSSQVFAVSDIEQLETHFIDLKAPVQAVVIGISSKDFDLNHLEDLLALIRSNYDGGILLLSCDSDLRSKLPAPLVKQYDPLLCLSKPCRKEILFNSLNELEQAQQKNRRSTDKQVEYDRPFIGKSILLVEDNSMNRNLIGKLLKIAGANVSGAENGLDAVNQCKSDIFDAILMDVHMPEMNGIDATKQIRLLSNENSDIPIIGLTANVMENEDQALTNAGVDTVLFKPVNEDLLIDTLQNYMFANESSTAEPSQFRGFIQNSIDQGELIKELKSQLDAVNSAFRINDYFKISEHAHQMSGLAGAGGHPPFAQASKDLELTAKSGVDEDIIPLIEGIERLMVELEDQV